MLSPNPPRLVTVAIAVALVAAGVALALPVPPAVDVLEPIGKITAPWGLPLRVETGYLCLFAGDALLIAGSLLPGI